VSYFVTAIVVFIGGIASSAVWLWFSTDGYFDSLYGRLLLIVLMLIPAVVVSGVAGIVAGLAAPVVVGLVKVAVALVRWLRRKRAARRASSPLSNGTTNLGDGPPREQG
jgi:hypothetical protein